jgi:Family of unknown function (DUF6151)
MSRDAELSCRCGEVQGCVKDAAPRTVNRVVCYCDDCQAFLHYLRRPDLFDAHGGTDIVQVAPASLAFHRGTERIVGLRLTPKGLYRWYSGCCHTPLGNTVGPAIPFVGIVARAFDGAAGGPDAIFGKPLGAIFGKYAIGPPPEGSTKRNLRIYARAIRMVVGWRLSGRSWPHPFFDRATGLPSRPLTTLLPAERDALRPLCGPRPISLSRS